MRFPTRPTEDEMRHNLEGLKRHFDNSGNDLYVGDINMHRGFYDKTLKATKEAIGHRPVILVFSSSKKIEQFPQFMEDANQTGKLLANTNAVYAYGNGNVGLMGEAAQSFIENRKSTQEEPHHIIGIGTPDFREVEDDLPGTVVFVAPDLDLRVRFMIDLADALICLPGGLGTLEEYSKFLSHDAYVHKTGRPVVFINTPFDSPRRGKTGSYTDQWNALQTNIDLGTVDPSKLENAILADTPEDAIAYLLDREDVGLEWTKKKNRPVTNTGIQKLDPGNLPTLTREG